MCAVVSRGGGGIEKGLRARKGPLLGQRRKAASRTQKCWEYEEGQIASRTEESVGGGD